MAVSGRPGCAVVHFRVLGARRPPPDALRGRLSAVHIMVVTGGPRLGDFEAGGVATLVSPWFSVVSGGVACVLGVLALARVFPELGRYHAETALPRTGSGP